MRALARPLAAEGPERARLAAALVAAIESAPGRWRAVPEPVRAAARALLAPVGLAGGAREERIPPAPAAIVRRVRELIVWMLHDVPRSIAFTVDARGRSLGKGGQAVQFEIATRDAPKTLDDWLAGIPAVMDDAPARMRSAILRDRVLITVVAPASANLRIDARLRAMEERLGPAIDVLPAMSLEGWRRRHDEADEEAEDDLDVEDDDDLDR